MKNWIRRLRGAMGIGVSWGIVWGMVGGVLEAIFGLPLGASGAAIVVREFLRGFIAFGFVGFIGSGAFSLALSLDGRRRSFSEMSAFRFALLGGLAGLGVGLALSGAHLITLAVTAGTGAATAGGSFVLALRAHDPEALRMDEEISAAGLTEQEMTRLLG